MMGMSRCMGGANVESGYTALLWRSLGIPVTIIPASKESPDNPWIERLGEAGCKIMRVIDPREIPDQTWLHGRTIVDFAVERAVRLWPTLLRMGCKLIHVPCMTATTPSEADNFRHNPPSAVVFQSEFQRSQLSLQYTLMGVPADRQVLIRGAFSIEDYPFTPSEYTPGAPFIVTRIARPDPVKWPSSLVRILEQVRASGVDARGHFLGWTPAMERFSGPLPTWCRGIAPDSIPASVVLRDSHAILCHGTCNENWPRVILEAFAAGVPVVADNHSGFREMIQHGETGLLASTTKEFADALLRLATDEAFRQRMASRARAALEQLADPAEIGGKWRSLFAGL
jgi:hypothetical protein